MWKKPYKKGDFPVELDGKKHNCPNRQSSREGMFNFDMFSEPTKPRDKYEYCGKCGGLCDIITEKDKYQVYKEEWRNLIYIGAYCKVCKMFPNTTHDGDKDGVKFKLNPNVKALMITNKEEIEAEFRGIEAPVNWICMNIDGTMKSGYELKLNTELKDWYAKDGKSILEDMYSKIWWKVKEYKLT